MSSSSTSSVRTIAKPPVSKPDPKPPRKPLVKLSALKRVKVPRVRAIPKLPWLIVLLALVFSIFMFVQYRDAKAKLQPTNQNNRVLTTVQKVGKIMVLPAGQPSTVATVKDVSKLRQEAFYANAQNGDILLVYSNAKKAILYRPSTNQIVNVAPVTVTPTAQ